MSQGFDKDKVQWQRNTSEKTKEIDKKLAS